MEASDKVIQGQFKMGSQYHFHMEVWPNQHQHLISSPDSNRHCDTD